MPQKCGRDVLTAYLRSPLFLTYPDRCDNIAAMGLCVFRCVASATHFLIIQKEGIEMKQVISLLLALVLCLSLCACGGGNDTPVTNDTNAPVEAVPTKEELLAIFPQSWCF